MAVRRWWNRSVDTWTRFLERRGEAATLAEDRDSEAWAKANTAMSTESHSTWSPWPVASSKLAKSLKKNKDLTDDIWALSGLRLVYHCRPHERRHGDFIIRELLSLCPAAF